MFNIHLLKRKSFGIDLGNTNTLVTDREGVLIDQPSCIVLDDSGSSVRAVGDEAYGMFEKTHAHLKTIKPLQRGVIADQPSAAKMVSALMQEAYGDKSFLHGYDDIIGGVPYFTTNVERRAVKHVLEQFNASHTYLLYEPLAAALGMGLDIREPNGKMIVDIGGGITESVIISLSGIASFQSLKVAGDTLDDDIQHYFRKQCGMGIGLKTAEQVKIQAGAVLERIADAPPVMEVKGKDLLRGIPVSRQIDYGEVARILDRSISTIELNILQTLEKCPPELASDIYGNGIHITGGNALLRGLKERLEKKVKLKIHIDPAALLSVSRGVARVLSNTKKFSGLLLQ